MDLLQFHIDIQWKNYVFSTTKIFFIDITHLQIYTLLSILSVSVFFFFFFFLGVVVLFVLAIRRNENLYTSIIILYMYIYIYMMDLISYSYEYSLALIFVSMCMCVRYVRYSSLVSYIHTHMCECMLCSWKRASAPPIWKERLRVNFVWLQEKRWTGALHRKTWTKTTQMCFVCNIERQRESHSDENRHPSGAHTKNQYTWNSNVQPSSV